MPKRILSLSALTPMPLPSSWQQPSAFCLGGLACPAFSYEWSYTHLWLSISGFSRVLFLGFICVVACVRFSLPFAFCLVEQAFLHRWCSLHTWC